MLKTLNKQDYLLIKEFFNNISPRFKNIEKHMLDNLGTSVITCAYLEGEHINSLIISNLINNQYYMRDIIFLNKNMEEFKELIRYSIDTLRVDERGTSILYDNYPYNEEMSEILLESGFKCGFLNYKLNSPQIKRIKNNITINDRSEEIKDFIYENYLRIRKSNDAYMGCASNTIARGDIKTEYKNMAICRDNEGIKGTASFTLVSSSIFINMIYAEEKDIYVDLINLIGNLTNRPLEVGLLPVRRDLMEVLNDLGFIKLQADYIYYL